MSTDTFVRSSRPISATRLAPPSRPNHLTIHTPLLLGAYASVLSTKRLFAIGKPPASPRFTDVRTLGASGPGVLSLLMHRRPWPKVARFWLPFLSLWWAHHQHSLSSGSLVSSCQI